MAGALGAIGFAAAAAVGGAGVVAGIGGIVAFAVLGAIIVVAAIAVVAVVISMVLSSSGESGTAGRTQDEGIKQRIPTDPRNKLSVIYGERKQAGAITMVDIAGDDSTLYFILSLCEGPCEDIYEVLYGDKYLSFDGDLKTGLRNVTNAKADNGKGENDDFLNGNMRVKAYLEGGRCSEMEANSSVWRSNASTRAMPNIAYVYIELDYDREKRVTGLENRLHFFLKGMKVTPLNSGSASGYTGSKVYSTNPAECLLDYLTNTTYGCSIPYDDIDFDSIYRHKKFCNETHLVEEAGSTTTQTSTDVAWTGLGILNVPGQDNVLSVYPWGVGSSLSVGDVLSPNPDGSNSTTLTSPGFAFIQVADDSVFSNGDAIYLVETGIETTNVANSFVLKPRYTSNGMLSTTAPLDKNILDLLSNNSAWFTYTLGKFGVISDRASVSLASNTSSSSGADIGIEFGKKYMVTDTGTGGSFSTFGATGGSLLPGLSTVSGTTYDISSLGDQIFVSDSTIDQPILRELAGLGGGTPGTFEFAVGDAITTAINGSALTNAADGGIILAEQGIVVGDIFTANASSDGGDSGFTGVAQEIAAVYSEENMYGGVTIASSGFDGAVNQLTIRFSSKDQVNQEEDQIILELPQSSPLRNTNEPLLEKTQGLLFCNDKTEAERLGTILLNQTRQNLSVEFKIDMSNLQLEAGDVIGVRHGTPAWGYSGDNYDVMNLLEVAPKLFRVVSVEETVEDRDGGSVIYLAVAAQEYAPEVYEDNVIQIADVAANTNFSNPSRAPDIGSVTTRGKVAEFQFTDNEGGAQTISLGILQANGQTEVVVVSIAANATAQQVADVVAATLNVPAASAGVLSATVTGASAPATVIITFEADVDIGDAGVDIQSPGTTNISVSDGKVKTPFDDSSIAVVDVTRIENSTAVTGMAISWRSSDPFLEKVEFRYREYTGSIVDLDNSAYSLGLAHASTTNDPTFELIGLDPAKTYQVDVRGVSHLGNRGEWTSLVSTTGADALPADPINLSVVEEIYDTGTSIGFRSKAKISWSTNTQPGDIPTLATSISYKLSADANYIYLGDFSGEYTEIDDIVEGTYDFQIEAISATGSVSATKATVTGVVMLSSTAMPAIPTGLTLTEVTYNGGAAVGFRSNLEIDWTDGTKLATNVDLSSTVVQYKLSADLDYIVFGNFIGNNKTVIADILPGVYDVRIFSVGVTNTQSAYVSETSFTVVGLVASPATPVNMNVNITRYNSGTAEGFKSKATITWDDGTLSATNVNLDYSVLYYKLSTDSDYTLLTNVSPPSNSSDPNIFVVDGLEEGTWDFKMKAVSVIGSHSPEVFSLGLVVVSGVAYPPLPNTLTPTEVLYETPSGFKSNIELTWVDGVVDPLVHVTVSATAAFYKLSVDPTWIALGDFTGIKAIIPDITADQYDFKVFAKAITQTTSSEVLLTSVVIDGLIAPPPSPVGLSIVDDLYNTNTAAGVKNRALITWTDGTVIVGTHMPVAATSLSYKLSSDNDYIFLGKYGAGGGNVVINDIAPAVYDFKVVAESSANTLSTEAFVTGVTIQGLATVPQDPTGLSLNASSTQALLTWDIATDLDVTSGGIVQLRYHPNIGAGATWSTSQIIVAGLQGLTTGKSVTLLTGTYLIKFFDSSGNESTNAAVVTNTFAPSGYNSVALIEEGPGFAGTKTNCAVDTAPEPDVLQLTLGQTLMTYDFQNDIDLGIVKAVRVAPTFEGEIFNSSATFCNITDVCGEVEICTPTESGSVKFYISTTQDDPTGSPTWSAYLPLISGDYSAWGIRIRVESEVANGNTLSNFELLGVTIDTIDKTEVGTVTTSASADTTVTYANGGFYAGISGTVVPRVGTQVTEGSAGDNAVVVNSTATGFDISVYNNGSRVVRTVDYQVIGQ